jgi:hypothetical protein
MRSALNLCAILFLAATLVAQTDTSPKRKSRSASVTAADVQALRDALASQQSAIAAQQQQIQELREELHHKDQAVQQAASAATDAASKADAAQTEATQQQQVVGELKSDVADLKTTATNTAVSLQETQKNITTSTESPLALRFKGITITPGGFLAAEFVDRTRALAADVNSPLNTVPLPGASQTTLSEFFGSGRQSRVSMLAEGRLKSAKVSGYVESDFLSAAVTSNNNQSNSYSMRQRQAWGQAAFDNGWSFTGGQMWSLLTETKHGVDNRTEALPMTIDAQYTAGFSWARQFGMRLARNFGNKMWLAVSMENPQATVTTHGNAANFLVGSAGAGGGLYNSAVTNCTAAFANPTSTTLVTTCTPAASYSFNPSPDVIAKAVFEPGFGHYEIFGIYSRFRDRAFPCVESAASIGCGVQTAPTATAAFNNSRTGGGFGVNARWTFAKTLDFGLHALGGNGIGRYGSAGLADASVHADGTLDLIRGYQGLGTIEWHGPKLDIYLNAGGEYASRATDFDPISGKYVGYGSPHFANSGCFAEPVPGSGGFLPGGLGSKCTGDTRILIEGTAGFWYKVYNGPKGRVQWGPQFSYVTRNTWSGTGGEPHGIDTMIFSSFRYYLP